jgi:UDP-GlcNAc:undecaprenyl-phosphate/decaprenyl-phosphate GlcNAc-1-phosphate transferase
MSPGFGAYALVGAAAALTTLAATPLVRRLSVRIGAVVQPDPRGVHETPTPTLGGLAMLAGVLVGMAVAWQLDAFAPLFASSTEPLGLVLGATAMFGIGMLDDLRDVSPPAKMSGQVLAASVLVLAGVSILVFRIPFGGIVILSEDLSYLVSVLWVVAMANALNLIDGLDGLAGGIVAIASGTFFLFALVLADEGVLDPANIGALVAIITFGVCVGFLPHNFHPARIFMGDTGALGLGLLMAASTMVVGGRTDQEFSGQAFFFFAPLIIPIIILGVPVLDTAFAIVRRATRRKGVAQADKDHLHHRLMRLGHGQRRSVLILWSWTALLSFFVLYPTFTGSGDAVVPIGVAALCLMLYTLFHPGLRASRNGGEASDVPGPDPATGSRAAEPSSEEPVG